MFQQDKTPEFWFCVGTFPFLDLYEENVHVLTIIIFLSHICVEKLLKPIWESLKVLSSLKKNIFFDKWKDSTEFVPGDERLPAVPGGGGPADHRHHHHDHLASGRPFLSGNTAAQVLCEPWNIMEHDWSLS